MISNYPMLPPQQAVIQDVHFGAKRISKGSMGTPPITNTPVEAPGVPTPQYAKAVTKFSFNAFNAAVKSDVANKNSVFSPVSLSLAMSMVLNGAKAETRSEIEQALQLKGLSMDTINKASKAYSALMMNMDPKVKIEIANSLWADARFPIHQAFKDTLKAEFSAEVANVDFRDSEAAKTRINTWISNKTNKLIPEMLKTVDANTIAAIVNTTYLNADWSSEFDAADNYKTAFTKTDGKKVDVNMMTQTGSFQHVDFQKEGFQAIKLPYGSNRKLSMVVMLPHKANGLSDLAAKMNDSNWDQWITKLSGKNLEYGRVSIPKHEVEHDLKAKDMLQSLGVVQAFEKAGLDKDGKMKKGADFSALFDLTPDKKPYISDVKHKAVIKVNEKGTEAAAATYVEFVLESAMMPRPEMFNLTANHGFITVIQDEETHTPLFITTVDNPTFIASEKPVKK